MIIVTLPKRLVYEERKNDKLIIKSYGNSKVNHNTSDISNKARYIIKFVALSLFCIYLFYLFETGTTFYLPYSHGRLLRRLRKVLLMLVSGKVLYSLYTREHQILYVFPSSSLFFLIWATHREDAFYEPFIFMALFSILLSGISSKKIKSAYLTVGALLLFAAIISSLSGGIVNFIYIQREHIRSSWGTIYPTDLSSHLFFFVLVLWTTAKKDVTKLCFTLCTSLIIFSRLITDSQTVVICSVLFLIVLLFYEYTEQSASHLFVRYLRFAVDFLSVIAFPLICGVTFLFIILYKHNVGFAVLLNSFITGRLGLAAQGLERYGITLFGHYIEMRGAGGSPFQTDSYNFVDSSYPYMLLLYGIVPLFLFSVLWVVSSYFAQRRGDRKTAYCMALICVHCFMEQHFTELSYNIFLILPFIDINDMIIENLPEQGKYLSPKRNTLPFLCCIGFILVSVIFFLPRIFSRIRTVIEILHLSGSYYGGREESVIVFIISLFVLLALVGISYGICCLIYAAAKSKKRNSFSLPAVIIGLSLLAGLWAASNRIIDAHRNEYASMIADDFPALSIITSASSGKIYSVQIPDLYCMDYPEISRSFMTGEDLARGKNASVIINADDDSKVFRNSGFYYCQISDTHAIYTNDLSVMNALSEGGYEVTEYYNKVRSLNMQDMATKADLPYSSSDGIVLTEENALLSDHYSIIGLYEAKYQVIYRIRIHHTDLSVKPPTVVLRATARWGDVILEEAIVDLSSLPLDEETEVMLELDISDQRGVMFDIVPTNGTTINLLSISYQVVPE